MSAEIAKVAQTAREGAWDEGWEAGWAAYEERGGRA